MSVESAIKALDGFHSLTKWDFDRIVRRHGVESDDEDLISRLIDEGWTYCPHLEVEQYIHDKPDAPPWNRLTAALRDP